MNVKNLILTPTGKMNRVEWLAFRQPITHIKKFLVEYYRARHPDKKFRDEQFFQPGQAIYKIVKTIFDSPEWLSFEFATLGASEIASVIGLNPYKSIIELYYEKVGLKTTIDEDNAAMFWGRELEEHIAEKWQYWEGTEESLFENYKLGRTVRKCRRVNFYIQNKAFPWLFVSLDRIINKTARQEGVLECKTISGWSADQWEAGIPPMYVAQLQDQLLVTELSFGEMAMLKDGRNYDVFEFDRHDGICEKLKRETRKFFHMVKFGAMEYVLAAVCPFPAEKQQHIANIDKFSPEPDGSLSYELYLKAQHQDSGYEIAGGQVELHLAQAYEYFRVLLEHYKGRRREASNKLRGYMKDASVLDFGTEGKVTWRENSKGIRAFRVRVKVPVDFKIDKEILQLEPLEVLPEETIDLAQKKRRVPVKKAPVKKKAAPKKNRYRK